MAIRYWILGAALGGLACSSTDDAFDSSRRSPPPGAVDGGQDGSVPIPPGGAIAIAEKPLLRLTYSQYRNALRDALQVTDAPLTLLPEELAADSYYNHASAQVPGDALIDAYSQIASDVAAKIVGDTARRSALVGCSPKPTVADPCLHGFVDRTSKRLYRRPLAPEDLGHLLDFAIQDAKDGWGAVQNAIEAMLQSPRFLYRVEPAVAAAERPGIARFDGYAMASRLSLTLVNTLPDEELSQLAAQDKLATASDVLTQAQRLLQHEGAKEGAREFYRQWLAVDSILSRVKDVKTFPTFSTDLLKSMEAETFAIASEYAAAQKPFLDILTADHTFVDTRLAALYGLPTAGTTPGTLTPSPVASGRLGILSQGTFLANQSNPVETSPTQRGLFVTTRLLCLDRQNPVMTTPVDDPTPDVPKTKRQSMELVHAQGGCQSCHKQMDGIGFGFEGFDSLGGRRTTDNGLPIDDDGILVLGAKEIPYRGPVELAQRLRAAPEVEACMVRHLIRWGLGRDLVTGEGTAEEAGAKALATSFATTDRSYASLVTTFVQSDFFRLRLQH